MRELNINKQVDKVDNNFLDTTNKGNKKGMGDMLSSPSPRLKGFLNNSETNFIDTSEYEKYLYPDKKDAYAFPFQADLDKSRAINQSNWEQAGHVAAKIIPNTALEFIGMVGNVLDFEDYANSDDEVGNWLNTWAQARKEDINEALPIYRENPTTPLDIGDFAWWAENGSALVESAGAFVGLGYLTGGAALSALSRGSKALEFLKVIGKGASASNTAKRTTNILSGLTNTLALNQAEGVGIATQVYDTAYTEALNELKLKNANADIEELEAQARQEAAKKASSALNFNRTNILLNLTSAFSFIKSPALTRQLIKNPSIKRSGRRVVGEGFQEAGEELVNLISENQALDENYTFDKAFEDVASMEGLEAALLGFAGGAGQTLLTNAGREIKMEKDKSGKRTTRNNLQRERYAEQQESLNRWQDLSKSEKFSNASDVYMKSKQSLELYQELQTAIKNEDTGKVNEIKNSLLRNQAYDAFTTGTTNQLIDVFKGIQNLSEEEAEQKALDPQTYKSDSAKAINTINKLEKEFNKAQAYVDTYSIYENRTNNIFLKNTQENLTDSLKEQEMEFSSDLADLNISDDRIEKDDNGNIKITDYNKLSNEQKNIINKLPSYNNYKALLKDIKNVDKDIQSNLKEYSILISDSYQQEVKAKIKEEVRKAKETQRKRKTDKAQAKNEEKKKKKKESFKQDIQEEEAPSEPAPVPVVEDVEDTSDTAFKFAKTGRVEIDTIVNQLETQENNVFNSDKSLNEKIDYFESNLNKIPALPITENQKAGLTAQYNNVIRNLKEQRTKEQVQEETVDVAKQNATQALIDFADTIAEPLTTDENQAPKQDDVVKKVEAFRNIVDLLKSANVPISFPSIAVFAEQAMGKDKFLQIFDDFQSIYNLSKVGERSKHSYENIFYTQEQKAEVISGETNDILNTYLSELYSVTDIEYKEQVENTVGNFLENQGYKLYSNDTNKIEGLRVIEAYNKIAHLDKEYLTKVNSNTTDVFNRLNFRISKADLNRQINDNASTEVLDFNMLNAGSNIQFKVLDELVLEDGSIVYGDGRVEKNGEITKNDPIETAPIGMIYDNKVIRGAYLHVPEWISPITIADKNDVKNQKAYLRSLRRKIIEAENQTLNTTIVERTDGHLMFDPDGTLNSVKENLPNVEIAVGKDNVLYTGTDNTVDVNRDRLPEVLNGWTYAVFPVNKGVKMATPIQPIQLAEKPEYVNSIVNAIRLYLNNDVEDKRSKELYNTTNIDITTIAGLRKYLNKFLYLNPNLEFEYEAFKNFVNSTDEKHSVIRIANDNIEFGRGANVGDTIRFINRDIVNNAYKNDPNKREIVINELLKALRNVLENNMQLNIKKDFLNKSFTLPLIEDNKVTASKLNYNDFVKENTYTSQYSVKLNDDKDLYTVQSNLEFNTDFIFPQTAISKELEEEAFGETTQEKADDAVSFGKSQLLIDFDNDLSDLAPKINNDIDTINIFPYIEYQKSKGNNNDFSNVEFINVYRAEGEVVEEDKLPKAVQGNAGTWFTNDKKEGERYANIGNRTLYKLAIPKVLYDNLYKSRDKQAEIGKGEIQLPKDLAILKEPVISLLNNTNLAPKTLTTEEINRFEATTPSSLTIQGISLPLQNTIINYLSYNIVKDVVKNNFGVLSLDYLTEFKETIEKAKKAYTDKIAETTDENKSISLNNSLKVLENIIKEYPKLEFIVVDKLRTFNNLKIDGKKFTQLKDAIEQENEDDSILESSVLEDTSFWSDGGIFQKDFRDKMSINLKNYLSSIIDVTGFNYDNDVRTAIPKRSNFLGIQIPVPFDHVVNEVTGILAYNNFDTTQMVSPSFDNMMEILENWVDIKPFIHNVIQELKTADEKIQNEFVSVMSKHYTNHIYLYRNKKGKLFINNSDNNAITRVIQDNWYNNIIESNLVYLNETRDYYVDGNTVEKISKDAKELIDFIKLPETMPYEITKKAKPLLDLMGFNFTETEINTIETKGIRYNKTPYKLLHLFGNSDGAFKIYIDRLNAIKNLPIEEYHPFANNTALNKFTRVLAKQNPVYFANSFRDVRSRLYYAYSPNKFIIDRFRLLKSDDNLLNALSNQPYSKNSTWLKELNTNPLFKDYFQYFTVDGVSIQNRKGKKLDQLSPAEYEESKVNLFFSQNRKGKNYIVNLFYPTTSNKTVQYGIKTLGKKWSEYIDPSTKYPNSRMIDELFEVLVQPEINRILNVQRNPSSYNVKNYKEGGTMFNTIPTLNNISELWEEDSHELVSDINTNERLKTQIKKELFKYIVLLTNNKINTWTKLGFVDTKTKQVSDANGTRDIVTRFLKYNSDSDADLLNDAYDYVINYLVGNMNVTQLFTTDLAFYWKSNQWQNVANRINDNNEVKEDFNSREEVLQYYTQEDWVQEHEDLFDNLGKRLAGDAAPGSDIPGTPTNSFKLGILADNIKESSLKDYFKGLLRINYPKVNATDAQEFTTLKEHLYIMNKQGKITTTTMNRLLAIDRNDESFSDNDLSIILQPMKPVYVSNIWTNGIEHRLYVKSSSFPLFRQLTKGLELDKLRKRMESKSIDRVAFESAVKIGSVTNPTQIFNSDGTINNESIVLVNEGNPIPRQGFKIQQEVPYKEKQVINDGTQQRKLLTGNVRDVKGFKVEGEEGSFSGQEIQDKIDETYNKIFKIKYDDLVNEIGYDVFTNEINNFSKLQQILETEGLTRKYSIYDLEALKEENGDFAVPLWLTGVSTKIEPMLNSIVDNRVRKFKPKGQSFVLGTSSGFSPVLEGNQATEYIKNTTNIKFDKAWYERGDFELKPMRTEKGKTLPAEVLIPFKMIDDEGNSLDVSKYVKDGFIDTEKLPLDVLKLFGFRIPTQNLNSMSMIKVVGFLPKESGDLLLAPPEWTVKMGSDFDVDKLYSLLYNITVDKVTGKVSKYVGNDEMLSLENKLLDLHFSILGSNSKKVQSELARPLSFGKLIDKDADTDLVREIYPNIKEDTLGIGLSEEYQTKKYRNARAGAAGIGVFSIDSVFNALIQNKNIYLGRFKQGEFVPTKYKLGGKWSNLMSDPKTNTNTFKSNVIEAYQSLSVDNENEQGLHKLNINRFTFDAIRGLIFGGFDEEYISYFINQPIIRKYVELKEIQEDSITNYTMDDLLEEIYEAYPISDKDYEENYLLYSDTSFEQMKSNVTNELSDITDIDTNLQRFYLTIFDRVSKDGQTIKKLQSAINSDSSGLGKDLFYSNQKENQVLELQSIGNVANATSLIGTYTPLMHGQGDVLPDNYVQETIIQELQKEWYNNKLSQTRKREIITEFMEQGYMPVTTVTEGRILNTIEFIKPDTISGFASVYALMLNNTLWSRYFPYNNLKLKNSIEKFSQIINRPAESITEKAELNRLLFNAVKSYLISGGNNTFTEGDIAVERERLLLDTKENKSLATIIKDLKSKNLINNAFINRLELVINKEVLPSNIVYKSNVAENIDERGVYAAFSKMFTDNTVLGVYNDIEYTPQKLAQDLVTHQMLTGGIQKANQFIKYIPINYLKLNGFYDYIKGINFSNEDDINYDNIENQLLQHNPKDVELSEDQLTMINGVNYKYFDNDTIIREQENIGVGLPDVFSIPTTLAKKGYKIYFYNKTANYWEQKDTLGLGDILEYNPTLEYGKTLIASNKTPEITKKDLPENFKDIEVFLNVSKNRDDGNIIYNPEGTGIVENYALNSNESSLGKISYILEKVIENDYNSLNTYLSQELLNNIDKIKDIKFIVDTTLDAQGSFNINDNTIKINPNEIVSNESFEKVILEEIIHAFTKKSIRDNSSGEVLRLKGLRAEAEKVVRKYLKGGADIKINTVLRKLEKGQALNIIESEIIYPILNTEEFVGRLFKSKKLQELLNEEQSKIKGKSLLDTIWDYIKSIIGLDVNKGSILDYAITDTISLLKQDTPPSSIIREVESKKRTVRTLDTIKAKYDLVNDDGTNKTYLNAQEIADSINNTVSNVQAVVVNNTIVVEYKDSQLGLFDDLAPKTTEGKVAPLLRSLNNRIFTLEKNIEKAKQRKEFDKEQALDEQLQDLIAKRNETLTLERLREISYIGQQDMQEVAGMFKNRVSLEDTLYIRKVLHFWKSAIDTLFNEDEKQSQTLLDEYKQIESEAARFEHKLEVIENAYMEKLLKRYGNDMSVEDVFYHFKDINGLQSYLLDVSRDNNELLSSIFLLVKEANIDATDEASNILKELSSLESKIRPILKSKGDKELYEVFRQKTKNGNLTGHLVNRFTYDFFKDKRRVLDSVNSSNSFGAYSNLITWANENTEHIKLNYLFPINALEGDEKIKADKYKAKLKKQLGENHYNDFMKKQGTLINNFANSRQGYLTYLSNSYGVTSNEELLKIPEAKNRYANWLVANSPYQFYNQVAKNAPKAIGEKSVYKSQNYIEFIPTSDNYYDESFKEIENNKDLLEFYNYFVKVDLELKQYMSTNDRIGLAINGLPHINKILLEQYKDKGMKAGLLPVWDAMKETVRRTEEGVIDYSIKDPVTGTEEKRLQLNLTRNNSQEISEYIRTKHIEYKLENNAKADKETENVWREEIISELAQKKSYDLPKVLRMYALTVLAYKHKSKIEDSIKLAQNILHQQQEYIRTNRGVIKTDDTGKPQLKNEADSFKNTKNQFDYFIQTFYGKTKEDEGITTDKVYTSEDKAKLKELNDLKLKLDIAFKAGNIEKDEYDVQSGFLEASIDKVGGVAVWSRRGDALLKYIQLKGMGWNIMSSIANVGFGFIANQIEASGGQLYTRKQLNKGYTMVFGSIGRNFTFNKWDAGQAIKIRSLMDKWDILKDSSKELFQSPLSIVTNDKTKWLAPYNLTQRTEYVNQAPIMIAMMLNTEIEVDGKTINLWEGYDENGKWKTEYGEEPTNLTKKLRIKIDQVNKMNHGNYDPNSPLFIKNKFWGRAISQFRSWMYEGYAVRFENEKYDAALEITRKGRYKSFIDYYRTVGFFKGTYGISKGFLKDLTFGLAFKGMDFEASRNNASFKEVDAANMRKIITELILLSSIYTSYLMLSAMAADLDDEEDRNKVYLYNSLINQGLRLKTDIMFYLNPSEFKNLLRDLIPATSLIKDTIGWADAVGRAISGEDTISSGVYSGHSRILRETAQMLPFGTQIYKNINYSIQTFDK